MRNRKNTKISFVKFFGKMGRALVADLACVVVHHLKHSHKKQKDSLETRTELAVLRTYVENQAILEPILLYRASKCKQTKEQGSVDCLWTHIFTLL